MRRISGLDINGWKDVAARDWEPDEPDIYAETTILDGGLGSVAVQQNSGEWIGGPQALLAPHGRGQGWGALGSPERRCSLASLLEEFTFAEPARFGTVFGAAVNALARGADDVLLGVSDVQEFDEAAQGRMLSNFHRDRRAFRLLWRPVAAFLDALESHVISKDADGELFCFLIHSGTGIDLQTLRLRRDSEHPDHVAPERDGYGSRMLHNVGMSRLLERANAAVLRANPQLGKGFCEESMLGRRLIYGGATARDTEILRLHNGNWIKIVAPNVIETDLLTAADFAGGIDFGRPGKIAAAFLLTPLAPPFAAALCVHLAHFLPNVTLLGWDAVARGCLRAGRLIEQGLPHYFDRLTPISLAVMRRDEPAFDDLIGSKTTLPANKEFVSAPYRDLKWLSGKQEIEFYVLKGDDEVRFWSVHLEQSPKRDVMVELRLRQTPGQSWAKLSLTSPEWEPLQRSPIFLDWAKLDPIQASPAEVLEKLKAPPPTIPMRIIEPPSIEFWTGSNRFVGLNSTLQNATRQGHFIPDQISELLGRSLRDPATRARSWTVGTEGSLPDELSDVDRTRFHSILANCEKQILAGVGGRPLASSGALKCLTWSFTLCPGTVQDEIVNALEADHAGKDHPLLRLRRARTLLTQGAGRAITGVPRLRRLLNVLAARRVNNDTLNALAMILSRRDEAPRALTSRLVETLIGALSEELVHLTARLWFQIRFKNALSATAGLFRYREVEPYSLLAGRDPAAHQLHASLEKVDALLIRHHSEISRCNEKRELVALIREYLDGAGDPNILIRIEDLGDEGASEAS